MHVSPPDSAAMVVLELWLTLVPLSQIQEEKSHYITVCMQNEVICRGASADARRAERACSGPPPHGCTASHGSSSFCLYSWQLLFTISSLFNYLNKTSGYRCFSYFRGFCGISGDVGVLTSHHTRFSIYSDCSLHLLFRIVCIVYSVPFLYTIVGTVHLTAPCCGHLNASSCRTLGIAMT